MKRKIGALSSMLFALSFVSALLFAISEPAEAQQPKKIPRIGFLSTAYRAQDEAFKQGLREIGYLEGKNISIEYQYGEKLSALASDLVRVDVEVIVAVGTAAIRAAKESTSNIPIVL